MTLKFEFGQDALSTFASGKAGTTTMVRTRNLIDDFFKEAFDLLFDTSCHCIFGRTTHLTGGEQQRIWGRTFSNMMI